MFRSQMDELEIADNVIPVLYLYTQAPEGTWPGFVTFCPWPCAVNQTTLALVIEMAYQRCRVMEVPAAVIH